MKEQLLQQITTKEQELDSIREKYQEEITKERTNILKSKSKGISKSLYLLGFDFESSSARTPQYLEFHRIFKKEFTAILKPYTEEILIHKPNHFDISGFFKLKDGEIYYFSIGDLRWDKGVMLIRTAENYKDYTGGSNNFIAVNEDFVTNLLKYIKCG